MMFWLLGASDVAAFLNYREASSLFFAIRTGSQVRVTVRDQWGQTRLKKEGEDRATSQA